MVVEFVLASTPTHIHIVPAIIAILLFVGFVAGLIAAIFKR